MPRSLSRCKCTFSRLKSPIRAWRGPRAAGIRQLDIDWDNTLRRRTYCISYSHSQDFSMFDRSNDLNLHLPGGGRTVSLQEAKALWRKWDDVCCAFRLAKFFTLDCVLQILLKVESRNRKNRTQSMCVDGGQDCSTSVLGRYAKVRPSIGVAAEFIIIVWVRKAILPISVDFWSFEDPRTLEPRAIIGNVGLFSDSTR